jgi:hypothetical protein
VARIIATVHITLSLPCGDKNGQNLPVKNWELVAEKLSKAGWTWGCVATVDSNGRTIWIVDAHRDNGKRFVVRSAQELTCVSRTRTSHARIIASKMANNSAQFFHDFAFVGRARRQPGLQTSNT